MDHTEEVQMLMKKITAFLQETLLFETLSWKTHLERTQILDYLEDVDLAVSLQNLVVEQEKTEAALLSNATVTTSAYTESQASSAGHWRCSQLNQSLCTHVTCLSGVPSSCPSDLCQHMPESVSGKGSDPKGIFPRRFHVDGVACRLGFSCSSEPCDRRSFIPNAKGRFVSVAAASSLGSYTNDEISSSVRNGSGRLLTSGASRLGSLTEEDVTSYQMDAEGPTTRTSPISPENESGLAESDVFSPVKERPITNDDLSLLENFQQKNKGTEYLVDDIASLVSRASTERVHKFPFGAKVSIFDRKQSIGKKRDSGRTRDIQSGQKSTQFANAGHVIPPTKEDSCSSCTQKTNSVRFHNSSLSEHLCCFYTSSSDVGENGAPSDKNHLWLNKFEKSGLKKLPLTNVKTESGSRTDCACPDGSDATMGNAAAGTGKALLTDGTDKQSEIHDVTPATSSHLQASMKIWNAASLHKECKSTSTAALSSKTRLLKWLLEHPREAENFTVLPKGGKVREVRLCTYSASLRREFTKPRIREACTCTSSKMNMAELTNIITRQNIQMADHEGLLFETTTGHTQYAVLADMLLCLFPGEHAQNPSTVVFLPGKVIQCPRPNFYEDEQTCKHTFSIIDPSSSESLHFYTNTRRECHFWVAMLQMASDLEPSDLFESDASSDEEGGNTCWYVEDSCTSESPQENTARASPKKLELQGMENLGYVPSPASARRSEQHEENNQTRAPPMSPDEQSASDTNSADRIVLPGNLTDDNDSLSTSSTGRDKKLSTSSDEAIENSQPTSPTILVSFYEDKASSDDHSAAADDTDSDKSSHSLLSAEGVSSSKTSHRRHQSSSERPSLGSRLVRKASDLKDKMLRTKTKVKRIDSRLSVTDSILEGYLYHKHLLKWSRLWGIVSDGTFKAYKPGKDSKPCLQVSLDACTVVAVENDQSRKTHVFRLSPEHSKNIYFAAESLETFNQWMKVLIQETTSRASKRVTLPRRRGSLTGSESSDEVGNDLDNRITSTGNSSPGVLVQYSRFISTSQEIINNSKPETDERSNHQYLFKQKCSSDGKINLRHEIGKWATSTIARDSVTSNQNFRQYYVSSKKDRPVQAAASAHAPLRKAPSVNSEQAPRDESSPRSFRPTRHRLGKSFNQRKTPFKQPVLRSLSEGRLMTSKAKPKIDGHPTVKPAKVIDLAAREIQGVKLASYLDKMDHRGQWISRWCVISGETLYVYDSAIDEETLDVLDLPQYDLDLGTCDLDGSQPQGWIFTLKMQGYRDEVFATENMDDHSHWTKTLSDVTNSVHFGNGASRPDSASSFTQDTEESGWSSDLYRLRKQRLLREVQRQREEIEKRRADRLAIRELRRMAGGLEFDAFGTVPGDQISPEADVNAKTRTLVRWKRLSMQLKRDTLQKHFKSCSKSEKGKKLSKLQRFKQSLGQRSLKARRTATPSVQPEQLAEHLKELTQKLDSLNRIEDKNMYRSLAARLAEEGTGRRSLHSDESKEILKKQRSYPGSIEDRTPDGSSVSSSQSIDSFMSFGMDEMGSDTSNSVFNGKDSNNNAPAEKLDSYFTLPRAGRPKPLRPLPRSATAPNNLTVRLDQSPDNFSMDNGDLSESGLCISQVALTSISDFEQLIRERLCAV